MWRIAEGRWRMNGISCAWGYRWTARIPTSSHYLILNLHFDESGKTFSAILPRHLGDTDISWWHRTVSMTMPSLLEPEFTYSIASILCLLRTCSTRTDQRISGFSVKTLSGQTYTRAWSSSSPRRLWGNRLGGYANITDTTWVTLFRSTHVSARSSSSTRG